MSGPTGLNVASTAAFQPMPGQAAYAAAKSFVLSCSQALSSELGGTNELDGGGGSRGGEDRTWACSTLRWRRPPVGEGGV